MQAQKCHGNSTSTVYTTIKFPCTVRCVHMWGTHIGRDACNRIQTIIRTTSDCESAQSSQAGDASWDASSNQCIF